MYHNRIWTEDKIQWLKDHKNVKDRQECYEMFLKAFPEYKPTFVAFCNERSRRKCCPVTRQHYSTASRPLYSEQIKKNYVRIKVAQPSVWMQKQKWVYLETHPEEYNEIEQTDCFIFLDGDNRNFSPENIERVHRREQTIYVNFGGTVKGHPELSKLHLLQARMKLLQLDAGEKVGLVVSYGNSRFFREEFNEKQRNRNHKKYAEMTEAEKEKKRAKQRAYYASFSPERRERMREYQRQWLKKKRAKNDGK